MRQYYIHYKADCSNIVIAQQIVIKYLDLDVNLAWITMDMLRR